MSLTNLLDTNPVLRAKLREEFRKPDFRVKEAIKAPPLTEYYGTVGRAFDYLFRFYIEKLNPCTKTSGWVAEEGLACLQENEPEFPKAKEIFEEAKKRYDSFKASVLRQPTREVAEAAVMLAHLELIYRDGVVDPMMFKETPKAILDDLEAMIALVRPEDFRADKVCVLNPTFGAGSALVRGADADLLIDDTLIDLKTNKLLEFDRTIFNQLVGYYVLSHIGGIPECPQGRIAVLGVYFARFGVLHRLRIDECIAANRIPAVVDWFKRREWEEPGLKPKARWAAGS